MASNNQFIVFYNFVAWKCSGLGWVGLLFPVALTFSVLTTGGWSGAIRVVLSMSGLLGNLGSASTLGLSNPQEALWQSGLRVPGFLRRHLWDYGW